MLHILGFTLFCVVALSAIGALVYGIILIPYGLAKLNLFWTIVDEGTCKIVVYLGGYHETLLKKQGYKVAESGEVYSVPVMVGGVPQIVGGVPQMVVKTADDGDIIPTTEVQPRGLRWVGIPPLYKVRTRKLKWRQVTTDDEGEMTIVPREDKVPVDFTLARDYVYGEMLKGEEDSNLLPLDVSLALTAWLKNPKKANFAVKDWFDAFIMRVSPYMRNYIAERAYADINTHDLAHEVFTSMETGGIIQELLNKWGIELMKVEVISIDPGEEFRNLSIQKFLGEQNARQAVAETAGRVLASVAVTLGYADVAALQADIANVPGFKQQPEVRQAYKEAWDLVKRDRAAAAGELADIRIGHTDGTSFKDAGFGALLGGLAVAARQFGSSGGSKKPKTP